MKPENFQYLQKLWIFGGSIFTGFVFGFSAGKISFEIPSLVVIPVWILYGIFWIKFHRFEDL